MKVLYIVTAYPRWPGDVITPWLVETIRRLGKRGVEVEVLAPSYRGLGDQEVEGVRVHRFRYAPRRLETLTHDQTAPDRVRQRPWYLALVPAYVMAGRRAAARVVREGGFDVVHVFWPVPHGLFGMAAKRETGVPLVSTFFGVELSWLDSQLGFLRPLVRRMIRASDLVTVISSHTAELVRLVDADTELRTIPFGAALREPISAPEPRVRLEGAPFNLLFVGRLVERKGVHVLLEAVELLTSRGRTVAVTVVGDGPERTRLEALSAHLGIGASVEFTGAVAAAELESRFRQSDAFVLPAVRDSKGDVEGLGVVLIEALLSGSPVIAAASGGIVDIVRHEETGLLVPSGDAVALADAIERFMVDPALAARLASAGLEHVLREFSWDAITEQLESAYEQVAASGRSDG